MNNNISNNNSNTWLTLDSSHTFRNVRTNNNNKYFFYAFPIDSHPIQTGFNRLTSVIIDGEALGFRAIFGGALILNTENRAGIPKQLYCYVTRVPNLFWNDGFGYKELILR
jgi:hypothetical protein